MAGERIKKAVFPVGGMGTRFLPATKANPKEMLPVVDKPLIQYAAEEAVEAGIEVLVFITGRNKRSIPDHFDKAYELESMLDKQGKHKRLEVVKQILPQGVTCIYIRQPEALGLGHAVLCAEPVVGDEPFAVILADDLIYSKGPGCLKQMVDRYSHIGSSILGVERIQPEHSDRYGIVGVEPYADQLSKVAKIVEKPMPEEAPSDLGVVGRYVLSPRIFKQLESVKPGAGGEIQLTDAIADMMNYEAVFAYEFEGKRYDCGDKLGYLQATVEFGLRHSELKSSFREYLDQLDIDKVLS